MKRILLAFALLLAVAGGVAVVSSAHADDTPGSAACSTNKC